MIGRSKRTQTRCAGAAKAVVGAAVRAARAALSRALPPRETLDASCWHTQVLQSVSSARFDASEATNADERLQIFEAIRRAWGEEGIAGAEDQIASALRRWVYFELVDLMKDMLVERRRDSRLVAEEEQLRESLGIVKLDLVEDEEGASDSESDVASDLSASADSEGGLSDDGTAAEVSSEESEK